MLGVEKEVVLVGNAAGFSAALDSRQAAAKRADRARRATHAPPRSLIQVAASLQRRRVQCFYTVSAPWASLASCSVGGRDEL